MLMLSRNLTKVWKMSPLINWNTDIISKLARYITIIWNLHWNPNSEEQVIKHVSVAIFWNDRMIYAEKFSMYL